MLHRIFGCGKDESIWHHPTHLGPYQPAATLTAGCLINHNWGCTVSRFSGLTPDRFPTATGGSMQPQLCACLYASGLACGGRRLTPCIISCSLTCKALRRPSLRLFVRAISRTLRRASACAFTTNSFSLTRALNASSISHKQKYPPSAAPPACGPLHPPRDHSSVAGLRLALLLPAQPG